MACESVPMHPSFLARGKPRREARTRVCTSYKQFTGTGCNPGSGTRVSGGRATRSVRRAATSVLPARLCAQDRIYDRRPAESGAGTAN
eukprot:PRCOL_00003653-RA